MPPTVLTDPEIRYARNTARARALKMNQERKKIKHLLALLAKDSQREREYFTGRFLDEGLPKEQRFCYLMKSLVRDVIGNSFGCLFAQEYGPIFSDAKVELIWTVLGYIPLKGIDGYVVAVTLHEMDWTIYFGVSRGDVGISEMSGDFAQVRNGLCGLVVSEVASLVRADIAGEHLEIEWNSRSTLPVRIAPVSFIPITCPKYWPLFMPGKWGSVKK